MRSHLPKLLVSILALALTPMAAFAQQTPPVLAAQNAAPAAQAAQAPAPALELPDLMNANFVDIGVRGTSFSEGSDEARYQRYRDLRNGFTIDAFRFTKDTPNRFLSVEADHAGYRDQRFAGELNQFGRLKATFQWNQVPLFFSQTTQALHTTASAGVLRIDDTIQSRIQSGAATLPGVVGEAIPFDMRLKRSIADFRLVYNATENIDINVLVRNTQKTGSQPWAGGFGFSDAVELAVPVDTSTTELGAALEWGGTRGTARVAYDGSYFRNELETLVWDNPLRISDSPTAGPLQGRMSLWPDSTLNTGSVMGTLNLPGRSHATGYVSIGSLSQDSPLTPFTINSALASPALARPSTEADAQITAMNYTFTTRPGDDLFLSARFRTYDFDNQMPFFAVTNTVSYDTSLKAFDLGGADPLGFSRNTFDADASYTPIPYTAFRVGYTREGMEQTFRHTDSTTEHALTLSADTTRMNWLTLRGLYRYSKRTGEGFDEQVLDDIGEQSSLRQFDITDKSTDRVSLIVIATPLADLSFNGSVSTGNAERADDGFGLLNADNSAYSIGADYVPREAVSAGVSYTWEKFASLQKSRQANPGAEFEDPRRDWTTDATERADTFVAGLDLIKALPRTDVKFAYTYSNASSEYFYTLTPDSTLTPVKQLPIVKNTLQRATFDIRYYLRRNVAIGGMYWYDSYSVEDFAQGPETLNSIAQPSFLMIGYTTSPYTANTFVARVTYIF